MSKLSESKSKASHPEELNQPTKDSLEVWSTSKLSPKSFFRNFKIGRRKLLAIFGFLLILLSVPAGIFLVRQNQEIRKKAQETPEPGEGFCRDGRFECTQAPHYCPDLPPNSKETWDSCNEKDPLTGKFINLKAPVSDCEKGRHIFKVLVEKVNPEDEIILHTRTNVFTCQNPCGRQQDPDKRCVCFQNKVTTEKDENFKAGLSQMEIAREVELIGGGCGSAQIDMFIDKLTVNGILYDCPLRSNPLCPNWPDCGAPYTLWFSGLEISECQLPTSTPTPPLKRPACNDFCQSDQDCILKTDPGLDPASVDLFCYQEGSDVTQKFCRNRQCPKDQDCQCDPEFILNCTALTAFDQNWKVISDFSGLKPGDFVYFGVKGFCNEPSGIDKAVFRINQGEWQASSNQKNGYFYINYQIPKKDFYLVEALVHNPVLGWR